MCVCFFLNFIVRIRTKRERETRRREPFEQHAVLNTVLSGRAPGAGKGSRPTRRPCPRSAQTPGWMCVCEALLGPGVAQRRWRRAQGFWKSSRSASSPVQVGETPGRGCEGRRGTVPPARLGINEMNSLAAMP